MPLKNLRVLWLVALCSASTSRIFAQTTTTTGDTYCSAQLCVAATVNGSTVEYVLQSTGSATLGWMAMGFGTQMANTPMVIMWPNSDSSITLSQRKASSEVMPTVDSSPARVATVSTSLSSTSGTKPKLAFTIPVNSDTTQNIIWAFGTHAPSGSAVDATLQQHLTSGTASLDLTKTTTSTSASNPSSTDPASSSPSSGSTSIPLLLYQKYIIAHAIMCAVGFLFFLPMGVLLARYLRTFSPMWFREHWIVQVGFSGPIIVTGVTLGICSVQKAGAMHLDDPHKKWGIAIFILYFVQCGIGAFIHWVKPKNYRGRPPQNYLHALLGLLIIGLALYQVRLGIKTEWPATTGRGDLPKAAGIVWYVWVVLLPLLYFGGLSLLPRQFQQEGAARARQTAYNMQPHSRYRDEPEAAPLKA